MFCSLYQNVAVEFYHIWKKIYSKNTSDKSLASLPEAKSVTFIEYLIGHCFTSKKLELFFEIFWQLFKVHVTH